MYHSGEGCIHFTFSMLCVHSIFLPVDIILKLYITKYRGTASKRQMEVNLDMAFKEVDFTKLTTATLDNLDGLSIKNGIMKILL